MPLQQLVEYFNDRLEQEHHAQFRPFILENDAVYGLFGPIRIGSQLSPIRKTENPQQIIGHAAKLAVSANQSQRIPLSELDSLVALLPDQVAKTESIVNFDRLSRAVHMLNYLPQAHLDELLVLDVDPRHILGVKEDHGAYFEEVIIKCGLQTENVVIALSVNATYARFYQSLLKGLGNYQRRGYRLMLKFDYYALEKPALDLISRVSPEFVGLSAQNLERVREIQWQEKLQYLHDLIDSIRARSVLCNVEDKIVASLARTGHFDLVEGSHYEQVEANLSLTLGASQAYGEVRL